MEMFLALSIYFLADGSIVDVPVFLEQVTYEECMTRAYNVGQTMLHNPDMEIFHFLINCHPVNSVQIY